MVTGLGYVFMGNSPKQRLIRPLVSFLYRKALAANSKVFFLNSDDRRLFGRLGIADQPGKSVLINGEGIDIHHFSEQRIEPAPPKFLMIARLIRDKGIREYAEAARLLGKRHPQALFRLLGPPDVNPTAVPLSQIQAWHGEGRIEYLGETRDVRPYLADANVFVLPSYREGLPVTIMEAMASGRPVVTTNAPGCRETVVDGDNGFLVPVGNAEALAEAMERFALQPELIKRMGRRSREIAEEKYDVHKVNATIMKSMALEQTGH
jgi:glycosyltransferase involved in cell wall biosynthesis